MTENFTAFVTSFWRVGHKADPLHVPIELQGGPNGGRYDDRDHEFGVLYAAPDRATCMLEKLRSTSYPLRGRRYRNGPVIDDEGLDALTQREEEIASRPRRVRPDIYDCVWALVLLQKPLMLLEVLQTRVLEELSSHPRITPLLRDASRLTIGDLLGSRVEIPQTVSAILMRQHLLGEKWAGIQALSTHGLHTSYAIFEYHLWNSSESAPLTTPITPDDATLRIVALQLGLTV